VVRLVSARLGRAVRVRSVLSVLTDTLPGLTDTLPGLTDTLPGLTDTGSAQAGATQTGSPEVGATEAGSPGAGLPAVGAEPLEVGAGLLEVREPAGRSDGVERTVGPPDEVVRILYSLELLTPDSPDLLTPDGEVSPPAGPGVARPGPAHELAHTAHTEGAPSRGDGHDALDPRTLGTVAFHDLDGNLVVAPFVARLVAASDGSGGGPGPVRNGSPANPRRKQEPSGVPTGPGPPRASVSGPGGRAHGGPRGLGARALGGRALGLELPPPRVQRVAAYGLAVRDSSVLLTRLAGWDSPVLWTLPGGGIDVGEQPEDALHREIWEETGLRLRSCRLMTVGSRHFTGHSPSGRLEDFHGVWVLYSVELEPGEARVVEVGGTTAEVAWIPLDRMPSVHLGHLAQQVVDALRLPPERAPR